MAYASRKRIDEINMNLAKAREIAARNVGTHEGNSDVIAIAMGREGHFRETKWMQYVVAAGKITVDENQKIHFKLPTMQQMENKYIDNKGQVIKFYDVYDKDDNKVGTLYTGLKNNKRGLGLRGEATRYLYHQFGQFWKNRDELFELRKALVKEIEGARDQYYMIDEEKTSEREAMKTKIRDNISAKAHALLEDTRLIQSKLANLNYLANSMANNDVISDAILDIVKKEFQQKMKSHDPEMMAYWIEEEIKKVERENIANDAVEFIADRLAYDDDEEFSLIDLLMRKDQVEEQLHKHQSLSDDQIQSLLDGVHDREIMEAVNAMERFMEEIDKLYAKHGPAVLYGEPSTLETFAREELNGIIEDMLMNGINKEVIAKVLQAETDILKESYRDNAIVNIMENQMLELGFFNKSLDMLCKETELEQMDKRDEMPEGYTNSFTDRYGDIREDDWAFDERE